MCDLVSASIAGGILSSISIISDTVGTIMSEKEKAERVNEANYTSAQNAIDEQLNNSNQEGIKQQKEREKLSDKKLSLKIDGLKKESDLIASSNASGNAYDNVLRNQSIIDGNNMSGIDKDFAMIDLNSNVNRQSYKKQAQRKIGSLQEYTPKNTGLIIFDSALKIGSSMLNTYKGIK